MVELDHSATTELLRLQSAKDVEAWMRQNVSHDVFTNDRHWRLVGDQPSNAGAIGASPDEINPLIERVVNGMEAVVELKFLEWEATHAESPPPSKSRSVIERLFDIPQGRTSLLSETQAPAKAGDVEMVFRGDRTEPTIVVRDKGLGIHPNEFSSSIVSLGQSQKGQKPYLVGMYGQGGSSTFDKCQYTIIVSRRHPDHLLTGQADLLGWTIVRRNLATRSHVYTYLVDPVTNEVPREQGSISDAVNLEHGTHISHIGYRNLGGFATQQITNYAFYTLNYRVFDPLIPWTLTEERQMDVRGSRTMRGVPYRLGLLPQISGTGAATDTRSRSDTAVRHHMVFEYDDPSFGRLTIEWWVLQDEQVDQGKRRRDHKGRIDPYKDYHRRYSRRRVAITRGGQTHAALTQQVFERARLRQLARSMIVHVSTDDLSFEAGASFFASNRAELKTDSQQVIENALTAAIDTYRDELRSIERERQEEIVRGRSASDEEAIRSRLDRLITAFSAPTPGSGNTTQRSRGNAAKFHGREIPTYLRFARVEDLPIRPGVPTHLDLLTDASDRTVANRRNILRINTSNDLISSRLVGGGGGRWRIELVCSSEAPVGLTATLNALLENPGVWRVETDRNVRLVVQPPPPPYVGKDPPTIFRFRAQNGEVHVRRRGARITMESDAVDSAFDHATLDVTVPDAISLVGHGHPRNGQIRLSLSVPEDAPLGVVGLIRARLNLPKGSELVDEATLVVEPALQPVGTSGQVQRPDYRIIDVRQFPTSDQEMGWAEMPDALDIEAAWNGTDAGAYQIQLGDDDESEKRRLVFFLNADNRDLQEAERRITAGRSETVVEVVRQYHRTLTCYYLYQMALDEINAPADTEPRTYDAYRNELIRLNKTLFYAQREFYDSLLNSEASEED